MRSFFHWQHIDFNTFVTTNSILCRSYQLWIIVGIMTTSSKGNIFRVTGHLCGEFTGEFPAQRPVTRSFDVFCDLRLNKRLIKQSWGWWFETLSRPLWRYCNVDNSWNCISNEPLWEAMLNQFMHGYICKSTGRIWFTNVTINTNTATHVGNWQNS